MAKKIPSKYIFGRPPGTPNRIPRGLEILEFVGMSRSDAAKPKKGLKKLILSTHNEEHAVRLLGLMSLIKKHDKDLMALLSKAGSKARVPKTKKG